MAAYHIKMVVVCLLVLKGELVRCSWKTRGNMLAFLRLSLILVGENGWLVLVVDNNSHELISQWNG